MKTASWFKKGIIGFTGVIIAILLGGCPQETEDTTPGFPVNFRVTAVTGESVTLRWDPAAKAVSYTVDRSDDDGYNWKTWATRIRDTGYTDTHNLSRGTRYYYRVKTVGEDEESLYSGTVSSIIRPETPAHLLPTVRGTIITLNWDPVKGASEYRVYCALASTGPFVFLEKVSYAGCLITSLSASGDYYFKVSAWNDGGESEQSDQAMATIP